MSSTQQDFKTSVFAKTGLSVRYSVIIKKMLQKNRALRRLDLSGNERFTDSGAHCVFVGLRHNSTLVDLNLRKTGITASNSDVRRALTKLLQVNKKLKGLNLSGNNQFSHSGVRCIFEGLRTNSNLTHLRLKSMNIKPLSFTLRTLAELLKTNKSITYLNLSGNAILSEEFARCIFESLQHNTSLVTLDLSRTAIDSVNYEITILRSSMASSVYNMLKKNRSLTTLKLSGNCYTCLYVSKIFRGLRYNTTLRHLDLSKMTMTDEAIDALENGIMSKYSLQTLDISGALVSASGADRILYALELAISFFKNTLQ